MFFFLYNFIFISNFIYIIYKTQYIASDLNSEHMINSVLILNEICVLCCDWLTGLTWTIPLFDWPIALCGCGQWVSVAGALQSGPAFHG